MIQSCQFVTTASCGLIRLVSYVFTVCPGSFPSCRGETSSKSVQEVDPDKLGFTTSCWGDETNPTFSHTFV